MCGINERSRGSKTPPRPSWKGLYALAGLMLAALLLAQALVATGPERTGLQCVLVLGGFAAMVQWTRRNRAALDHLDWCECASSRITVRVIHSGREQPAPARYTDPLPWIDAEPVETMEEIAR
jgi:hypothetical protein